MLAWISAFVSVAFKDYAKNSKTVALAKYADAAIKAISAMFSLYPTISVLRDEKASKDDLVGLATASHVGDDRLYIRLQDSSLDCPIVGKPVFSTIDKSRGLELVGYVPVPDAERKPSDSQLKAYAEKYCPDTLKRKGGWTAYRDNLVTRQVGEDKRNGFAQDASGEAEKTEKALKDKRAFYELNLQGLVSTFGPKEFKAYRLAIEKSEQADKALILSIADALWAKAHPTIDRAQHTGG